MLPYTSNRMAKIPSIPAARIRPLNPPAFPVGRFFDTKGASLADLYAMGAPAVPAWFEPKTPRTAAAQLERLARWRFAFAEKMLTQRSRSL